MSTRITNAMVQRSVLNDLNAVSKRLTQTQERVASGKQITRPSDDPFSTSRALALRGNLDATRQYQRNVDDGTTWRDLSEQALNNITESVQRVQELLVKASSDTMDQAGRDATKSEIDQLIDGIKQGANATYQGRYIFSGSKTGTPPYQDGTDDAYGGDTAQIARQIGPGVSVPVNVVAKDVLGAGKPANDHLLLNTLRNISDHLRDASADPSALQALRSTDMADLNDNLDQVLAARADNGAVSNRLASAQSRLEEVEQSQMTLLSETEDADIAKTLIDFNSQSAAYQAALKAGANIIQPSLIDFLR